MKKYIYIITSFSFFLSVKSQVGIGTTTPSSSAVLELNSSNKGLLLNSVSLNATTSPNPFTSHIEGMWVYNIASSGTIPDSVVPGLYYNDGTKWVMMSVTNDLPKLGDIKSSIVTTDHDGWYTLNGRNISTLPVPVQNNAATLGFTTQLPNTSDRILKGKNNVELIAATGGASNYSLTQANLPAYTITGTTTSAGAHTHSYVNNGNTSWNYNAGTLPATLFVTTLESRTTQAAGDHSHTISVSSGGSGTAVSQYPKNISVQYFIYLGK